MITADMNRRLMEPWLISELGYLAIQSTIEQCSSENFEVMETEEPQTEIQGEIAIVPLKGTMLKNPNALEKALLGATDTDVFAQKINEIRGDDSISAVVLDIDSAGGSVGGVAEASTAVRNLEKKKPVVTHTSGLMASAAYWVGSQATMITAGESARVGSIGVYLPFVDASKAYEDQGIKVDIIKNKEGKFKGAGYLGTSLTKEQRGQLQAEVQEIFEDFRNAVENKRGVSEEALQGQTFSAKASVNNRLVDVQGNLMDAILLAYAEKQRRDK
jgi:signal peptide peptidase SppA